MSTKEGDWISANAMALDILWILSDYPHTKKKEPGVPLCLFYIVRKNKERKLSP